LLTLSSTFISNLFPINCTSEPSTNYSISIHQIKHQLAAHYFFICCLVLRYVSALTNKQIYSNGQQVDVCHDA